MRIPVAVPFLPAKKLSHNVFFALPATLVTGQAALAEDVYEQASIQYHSIRDIAAYTTPRAGAGLSLWHMLTTSY